MRVHKKMPDELQPEQGMEMVQPQSNTGYETCQSISDIKAELDRLKIEMDKYTKLAMTAPLIKQSTEYYTKSHEKGIRYWAIRWVMGWENEVPE